MNNSDETGRRVIVLDTSAFIAGLDPFSINEEQYTVPMVNEELRGNSMAAVRLRTAVESGKLAVRVPARRFIERIKQSATLVGDSFFLSETDLQVLALALELSTQGYSPLVASDDYSIQNVANQIGLEFAPLGTFGIRKRLQWVRHCPACHKKYPANYRSKKCMVCGTALRRKPLRKSHLQSRGRGEDNGLR
jgi:UPF0271 protein